MVVYVVFLRSSETSSTTERVLVTIVPRTSPSYLFIFTKCSVKTGFLVQGYFGSSPSPQVTFQQWPPSNGFPCTRERTKSTRAFAHSKRSVDRRMPLIWTRSRGGVDITKC